MADLVEITFGEVTLRAPVPSEAELASSSERSQNAFDALPKALAKRGVRIARRKDVPLFSAAPDRPGFLVRELNGKSEIGILQDGVFKAIG